MKSHQLCLTPIYSDVLPCSEAASLVAEDPWLAFAASRHKNAQFRSGFKKIICNNCLVQDVDVRI